MREQQNEQPHQGGITQTDLEQQLERLRHARLVPGTVVISCDRLHALRHAHKRQRGKLHHSCKDRHGADGDVAAVFQQGAVEADEQDAFRELHDERGETQRQTFAQQTKVDVKSAFLQTEVCAFAGEKNQHQTCGQSL